MYMPVNMSTNIELKGIERRISRNTFMAVVMVRSFMGPLFVSIEPAG